MTEMEIARYIDREFQNINRRMDDDKKLNADRHLENIDRFKGVEKEVASLKASVLTKVLATWYLGAFLGGVAALAWLLHIIGVLKP